MFRSAIIRAASSTGVFSVTVTTSFTIRVSTVILASRLGISQ